MHQESKGEVVGGPPVEASSESLALTSRGLWSRLRRWVAENPEAMARLMVWVEDQASENTDEPNLLTLGRSFMLNVAPPNWQSLRLGAHMRVDNLVCETGLCLVWVPDADVITSLLRAPDTDSRRAVLLAHENEILDSIAARLDEVAHPALADLRDLAIEAVETHRSGFSAPSQTLAAAIVTGVIEDHYGFRFVAAREAFDAEAPSTAGLWSHRRALVQRALQVAIVTSKSRTTNSGFNRHLTSHGTDPDHYNEAHAIEGLMLMAGSLRELNETYRVAEMGFGASPRLQSYSAAAMAGNSARRVEA